MTFTLVCACAVCLLAATKNHHWDGISNARKDSCCPVSTTDYLKMKENWQSLVLSGGKKIEGGGLTVIKKIVPGQPTLLITKKKLPWMSLNRFCKNKVWIEIETIEVLF